MGMLLRSPYPEVTAFDPLTIPNLRALWLLSDASSLWQDTSATTPVTSLDDPIARVDDQTGNGYHLLVYGSDNGRRPLYKPSAQNGLAGARFDGTDDGLIVSVAGWTRPLQVFLVYKQLAFGAANGNDMVASGPGITTFHADTRPATGMYAGGQIDYLANIANNVAALATFVWNGASSYIREDGVQILAGDTGTTFQPEGLAIGAAGWNGGRAVNIELYAAGVVKAPVTGTDLADAEQYFMTTWGL